MVVTNSEVLVGMNISVNVSLTLLFSSSVLYSLYLCLLVEEGKNAVRVLTEQLSTLQSKLDEAEHTLNLRLSAPVPRDLDSLEHLVIQHKDFETNLKVQPSIIHKSIK